MSVEPSRNAAPIDPRKSPVRSSSPPARSRSRSPSDGLPTARPHPPESASSSGPPPSVTGTVLSTTLPFSSGHGERLDQLKSIRLIPYSNPHRIFQLQRYTFPADTGILLKTGRDTFEPVPTQEQTVMSTSEGYVFALLVSPNDLAGLYIYRSHHSNHARVKINIESAMPTSLTKQELYETSVGPRRPIERYFRVNRVNCD